MVLRICVLALFYHSNANPPGVAGVCRIKKEAYPDRYAWNEKSKYYDEKSTEDSPRWFMVDVEFLEAFDRLVSLEEIKSTRSFEEMVLVKHGRLPVQPVKKSEFDAIVRMGRRK